MLGNQSSAAGNLKTPIGKFKGTLAAIRTDDLAAMTIAKLMDKNPDLDGSAIDDVILGCANQAGEDNRNVARMAALLAGLPWSVPGETVLGKISFDKKGDVNAPGYVMYEWKEGKYDYVQN